jgi:hypothetical protein
VNAAEKFDDFRFSTIICFRKQIILLHSVIGSAMSFLSGKSSAEFQSQLWETPNWLIKSVDFRRGLASFVETDERGYREAAFLDNRLDRVLSEEKVIHLKELWPTAVQTKMTQPPLNFLFHVGHCGSTLISRMLGELPGCFALREPPVLMALARSAPQGVPHWEHISDVVMALLARTYRQEDCALIKPASHANVLLRYFLQWKKFSRGVLISVDLESYLATMLQEHHRGENREAFQWREEGLKRLVGNLPDLDRLDDAKCSAMIWLIQMRELLEAHGDETLNTLWLSFDNFLAEPTITISKISGFLDLPSNYEQIRQVTLHSPLLRSYSKNAQVSYTPESRRASLQASRRRHAPEIDGAMDWLEKICQRDVSLSATTAYFTYSKESSPD